MNSNVYGFILVKSLAIVKNSSKSHSIVREKVWYSSQLLRWIPTATKRRIHSHAMKMSVSLRNGFVPFNRSASSTEFENMIRTAIRSGFRRPPRHNRDEFPRPMGFILQWTSSECSTVNPSISVEMNSRVQWGSLAVAQVSKRAWKLPIESCFWWLLRWVPAPNGAHSRQSHPMGSIQWPRAMNSHIQWGSSSTEHANQTGIRRSNKC